MQELQLTEREVKEIDLALYYERRCNHGTAGHNRLMLIAKLASAMGIYVEPILDTLVFPENVTVTD